MDFIQKLLEHTKIYESPTSFWKWSAYSAIASVLRDSCYKRQGDSYLYPNCYVLLLADSAIQRKGRPVELCESLVTKINNTKIISGRSSIQAILDELAHTETNPNTGHILKGGSATFFAPELSAGLVSDPQSISILTDIYDHKDNFISRLRGHGKFTISKIVFSMFAASNEELLKATYDQNAVYGGLLGRTFLILPNEFRESNSLMRPIDNKESYDKLVNLLRDISRLHGEYIISNDAIEEYDSWYLPFRASYKNKGDKSGIIGRLHTSVIKLAMLLAANELTLNVTKRHVEEAIHECLSLIPNYNQFVMASGKSTISDAGAIVLQDLLLAPNYTLSRKIILRNHWNMFDSEVLDKLIITLEQGELIRTFVEGSEIKYQMTPKCLEIMGSSQK